MRKYTLANVLLAGLLLLSTAAAAASDALNAERRLAKPAPNNGVAAEPPSSNDGDVATAYQYYYDEDGCDGNRECEKLIAQIEALRLPGRSADPSQPEASSKEQRTAAEAADPSKAVEQLDGAANDYDYEDELPEEVAEMQAGGSGTAERRLAKPAPHGAEAEPPSGNDGDVTTAYQYYYDEDGCDGNRECEKLIAQIEALRLPGRVPEASQPEAASKEQRTSGAAGAKAEQRERGTHAMEQRTVARTLKLARPQAGQAAGAAIDARLRGAAAHLRGSAGGDPGSVTGNL